MTKKLIQALEPRMMLDGAAVATAAPSSIIRGSSA